MKLNLTMRMIVIEKKTRKIMIKQNKILIKKTSYLMILIIPMKQESRLINFIINR